MGERSDLEGAYARTLLPLGRSWRQAADRALANLDVSAACGWALVQLGRLGDNIRQTDLARELDITGPSLVRLLDQLAAARMIERIADAADRRVSRVRLTDAGASLLTTIEGVLADLRHNILAGLSDVELANALTVARHVENIVGRPRGGT
ncbi:MULTISPECIES: MarR family winged helix-turn-helix transcriptional regulator [Sphingosinicellaceae]|uniref:MarR family winged helix-turn-helix transcriptional regulator n=1 Tax=Sphingosinicellaceae TaxID=2820280 RepID=UPI001C1E6877|nr:MULTISPECIES: MarR family transcriptional regulator [Polymorphobacter]QYE33809.1 MarR family transcriptional regulator [Polymorphobacter sp. PAMC 29334]UAJ08962.1 MarR family transcriptional regulator [Polymorphobacter megasporae]